MLVCDNGVCGQYAILDSRYYVVITPATDSKCGFALIRNLLQDSAWFLKSHALGPPTLELIHGMSSSSAVASPGKS